MKKLAVIFSIILSLLIVRGVFAENILQDNFIINRITKLIRLSTYFNQFLIGNTATSTDYVLEVHDDIWADDSMRANQFCINTTTPDCITAWPSGATAAYPINQWLDTTNTPTFVGVNASSTNVDSLVIYNGITLGGVYRNTWPAASGSSAGSWWATSSNNLIGYPDLAGDYSIVIGAAATTSEVKFEVNGSAKIGTNLIVGTELLAPAARLTVLNSTTTNIDNLTVYSSVSLPDNSITDAMVADTITASNYLSLVNWFATTTHANIASLPSLSITESQISDLSHYTDADTGNYIDASSTIQTYFSYANLAHGWGDHSLAGYLLQADWESTTTDALAEGSNNLYYTDARVGDYIDASTTIQTYFSNVATAYSWGDHSTAGYFLLSDWFSTTTHANISSLPSLSITESQISDLSHYTDADTGDYIDASTTIQTYFSNAATAYSWGNHATAGYLSYLVASSTYLALSDWYATTTWAGGGSLYVATTLSVATSTPWSGYELAVTGDGVFSGNLYVMGNATSSHFAADEICLNGTCRTTWPTDAGAVTFWEYAWDKTITTTSTDIGLFVTASSTVAADFRVDGNLTTTGTITAGSDLIFSSTGVIRTSTTDGSDTSYLTLSGGGAINDATRGGYINLYGNELDFASLNGDVMIFSGDHSNSNVSLGIATTTAIYIDTDGDVGIGNDTDFWGTVGPLIPNSSAKLEVGGNIYLSEDADRYIKVEDSSGSLFGGLERGYKLYIEAGDGDASNGGNVYINGGSGNVDGNVLLADLRGNVGIGTASPGAYKLNVNGNTNITGTGNFTSNLTTGGNMTVGADIIMSTANDIRADTTDGSDDQYIYLSGGGAANNTTRGSFINLYGNEFSGFNLNGSMVIGSGNHANSKIITTIGGVNKMILTSTNLDILGTASTTGHLYAGTNLYVGQASKGDNDFIYFDAGAEYLVWNNTSDLFVLSNDLSVTGYATTTAGLFTQGNLRVGGNATTTGSHEFTTEDGLHGLRIIPGSTTTTLDFF
jgi:hypothetical protein